MSKTVTSSVAFQDPKGTAIANGVLTLDLSQNAEITSGGGQVAPRRISITLDSTAKIPAATTMLANDELTPSGTTYTATLYDSTSNFVGNLGKWNIAGASPIDLSVMTPTNTGASYPAPVLLSPAALQKILNFNLELAKALVLDGSTSGTVTLQAAATAGSSTATLPANTGTLAETNLAQNWTATQIFTNAPVPNAAGLPDLGTTALPWGNVFIGAAATNNIKLTGTATGARTATLPNNSGTIAELNLAQSFTASQTIGQSTIDGTTGKVTTYNNVATVGNGVAASYGQDDQTAKSTSIGAVTFITGGASTGGHYQWNLVFGTTTSDASGATFTVTISWTQDGISRSFTSSPLGFNSTANFGQVTGPFFADNSTNVTYSTTVTGSPSTGRYAIHVWVAKQ